MWDTERMTTNEKPCPRYYVAPLVIWATAMVVLIVLAIWGV